VFGEQTKSFASVLGKLYGVLLSREGPLDQFAIDRGIINHVERLGVGSIMFPDPSGNVRVAKE
jgi:hypothetical protein